MEITILACLMINIQILEKGFLSVLTLTQGKQLKITHLGPYTIPIIAM